MIIPISELCAQFMNQGQVTLVGSVYALTTYHCSVPTLRTECTRIRCSASGESIGENDQADAIDPSELKD